MESKRLQPTHLSIVVPVLNEADSLPELYHRLKEMAGTVTDQYELIFVDDGSTDHSFEVLAGLQQEESRMTVMQLRSSCCKPANTSKE